MPRDTRAVTTPSTDDIDRFRERYETSHDEAMLACELEALGSDYQANGYTTRDQADDLGNELKLRQGQVLLDVGSGCGWPGLYLARSRGCAVITADPIAEGVQVARRRAASDRTSDRAWAIRANAHDLPIRDNSVDAVVQTDLMC